MQTWIPFLMVMQCAPVFCQPHAVPSSNKTSQIKNIPEGSPSSGYGGFVQIVEVRNYIDEKAMLVARATTATTDSTTSTTDTTTSTSSSETTTSSTASTTTSDSTTTSSTTSTSTTSTSTSSSTSTSTTSSSTTTTASTTISTTTSTSTVSAEVKEWNRKGNIAAIVFSCCLISLFLGISIIHCARDRAKSKRIAQRELLKEAAVSTTPLSYSKTNSTANLLPDRSSGMSKENPFSDSRPRTAQSTSPTPNNNTQPAAGEDEPVKNTQRSLNQLQRGSLV
ncbi:hypothetical protein VI817_003568 [Penicillium citrinum]|uniref:Mid2 domain-containing protein n=1 Tax=Penicillium hetheringtonii TaxID=911720 RepID=A0AAD6DNJ6_9EURO|nr:hypothetical protein N7450_003671 [Penicillium hetheringtonii]KAK5801356.1 hypothetical protein VI817_003568 [Penicillium citrinum]